MPSLLSASKAFTVQRSLVQNTSAVSSMMTLHFTHEDLLGAPTTELSHIIVWNRDI